MRKILTVWMCVLLLAGAFAGLNWQDDVIYGEDVVSDGKTYVTHVPIVITSDAEFTVANGVTGGDGSAGNPFIISGWEIDGSVSNNGIRIDGQGSTINSYFEIRDCYIYNSTYSLTSYLTGNAILIQCVDNCVVENNTLTRNDRYGVSLCWVDNCQVMNNNISLHQGIGGRGGVQLYYCYYNQIYNNQFNDNSYSIQTDSSFYNDIYNNTCVNGRIYIWSGSEHNNVFDNQISVGVGIHLYADVNYNVITNNTINNCNWGIVIAGNPWNTRYNLIMNNSISNCTLYGIQAQSSQYNEIIHNKLFNNTNQAQEDGTTNIWYKYPEGGNYWDNYVGDDKFTGVNQNHAGGDGLGDTQFNFAGGFDRYPLMEPWSINKLIEPVIELVSPNNNSCIKSGTILDFDVWDRDGDLVSVLKSINGGANDAFPPPYDIDINAWVDDFYNITISAADSQSHSSIRTFHLVVDNSNPVITLNSPINDSVIPVGVLADFNIYDINLDYVEYSVNGGSFLLLNSPYDINMSVWSEGVYDIEMHATDLAGNDASEFFRFTIDDTPPLISLNSPANNSLIFRGTCLDFDINDYSLVNSNYSINAGGMVAFPPPFDIETIGWPDGDYSIEINAVDRRGLTASRYFNFTIISSLQNHASTRINSNSDFDSSHGVIRGNGTQENPWVISGWIINGTDRGYCIYIGNTTEHFIIRDCVLYNATGNINSEYYRNFEISLNNVCNGTVENNTITGSITDFTDFMANSNFGIYMVETDGNVIGNNTISNNFWYGIYSDGSRNDLIVNNSVYLNYQSNFYISSSESLSISENNISDGAYGLRLFNSERIYMTSNRFNRCGPQISGGSLAEWNTHMIDTSNTLNGKMVHYWVNRTSGTVPEDAGGVILANCTGVLVENHSFTTGSVGVQIGYSYNNTVRNITANASVYGVYIYYSDDNIVENLTSANSSYMVYIAMSHRNTVSNCTTLSNWEGISMMSSHYNIFRDNIFDANHYRDVGMSLSDNNQFYENTFTNNANISIELYRSDNNIISGNAIMNNSCGLFIDGSGFDKASSNRVVFNTFQENHEGFNLTVNTDNNNIYHNHINSNIIQAIDLGINHWDDGYPSGGNLWSDMVGVDDFSGINQDQPGSDGLCDNPYIIDGDSRDNYPLMTLISDYGPTIPLVSPSNNSVIQNGTIIDLEIWDRTGDVLNVNYSLNAGPLQTLTSPYDLNTSAWPEGLNEVWINSLDEEGNSESRMFRFTIDSTKPSIILNAPLNQSVICSKAIIDIEVTDTYLENITYSVNGGTIMPLYVPYDIDTTGWIDGTYTIRIWADDTAGNIQTELYQFTLDSTTPLITLLNPTNNTIMIPGTIIDFGVSDMHLSQIEYKVNGGLPQAFPAPYDLNTGSWPDETYTIHVTAIDEAGNIAIGIYNFTIDSLAPAIILNSPTNNSVNLPGTILEFDVTDIHLTTITYSINGEPIQVFTAPFDIDTAGWPDGEFTITIQASDEAGNNVDEIFLFIIDSIPPIIVLNSPANNSVIEAGTVLNLTVNDTNLQSANYSVNGGAPHPLLFPHDIPIAGWADGVYTIWVQAVDFPEHSADFFFMFTIDSTLPVITLNSPANNSVILPGTILDFDVTDIHLASVNYSIDGGLAQAFAVPYDIDTIGWLDGVYSVELSATDEAGNTIIEIFMFIIDSTPPTIALNTPANNSFVPAETMLDFTAQDTNLNFANYSVNGGPSQILPFPHDIDSAGWADGDYSIEIHAIDLAGNELERSFDFTVDSTDPLIVLNNPLNNTLIVAGAIINLGILDANLNNVTYSINGALLLNFSALYDISTVGWSDGIYAIRVNVNDLAGNSASAIYQFTVDSTSPQIMLHRPGNNAAILPGTLLNFTISDLNLNIVNYSINGGPVITFSEPYDFDTTGWAEGTYIITISANDTVGNSAARTFTFTIDTTSPDSSVQPISQYWQTSSLIIEAGVNDTNGVANVTLWYRFSPDNATWESWTFFETDTLEMWWWNFDFPDGDGYYEFYSIANDTAGNMGVALAIADARCAYDLTAPIADAGLDKAVVEGSSVTFNGSASTDNISLANYTWTFSFNGSAITLYGVSPGFNFTMAGNYTVTLTVWDLAGNSDTKTVLVNVISREFHDTDGDGFMDADDAFPDDPSEWLDTDEDNIGDNSDPDDDNDGFPDEWEIFQGTDSLDPNDMPVDTDGDGIPDGDATNSQPWMDTDDDGDDIPDNEEISPPVEEPNFIGDYWWLILLITIVAIIGLMVILRRKPQPIEVPKEEPPELQTELCPKCGFDIEKGAPCPFCAPEPEPPKPAPPKSGLSNQEKLERIEKAYREGQMTEEQYLRNVEKFSKQ